MILKHFGICYTDTCTSNIYLNSLPKHFKLDCSGFIFYNKTKPLNMAYETELVLSFPPSPPSTSTTKGKKKILFIIHLSKEKKEESWLILVENHLKFISAVYFMPCKSFSHVFKYTYLLVIASNYYYQFMIKRGVTE